MVKKKIVNHFKTIARGVTRCYLLHKHPVDSVSFLQNVFIERSFSVWKSCDFRNRSAHFHREEFGGREGRTWHKQKYDCAL